MLPTGALDADLNFEDRNDGGPKVPGILPGIPIHHLGCRLTLAKLAHHVGVEQKHSSATTTFRPGAAQMKWAFANGLHGLVERVLLRIRRLTIQHTSIRRRTGFFEIFS